MLYVIKKYQFGFCQKRCADLQLLLTVHDLASSLNNKTQTNCILLDFSKAFDMLSHRLLLLKLKYFGTTGKVINWIQSFLTNRKQQVVCKGSTSDVTSGVPPGLCIRLLVVLIKPAPGFLKLLLSTTSVCLCACTTIKVTWFS